MLLLACAWMVSCTKSNNGIAIVAANLDNLPTIHGEKISSLISDSGITRYRLETAVWDIYSDETNPYWYFPQGAYIEKFDSLFHVDGFVRADTVYFFEKTDLWRLIGNVLIQNMNGETFETSELFWRQKEPEGSLNAIYTDSLVKITTSNGISTSQGIRSNQSMTSHVLYQHSYITDMEEEEIKNDTISPAMKP